MKLIHKLLFPVLFLSLMAVSAIGVGLWGLASTDDAARRAAAKLSDTHITAEVRSISRAVQRDALNLIFEPTDSGRQSIGARFDARLQQLDAALTRLPSQTAFADLARLQREVNRSLGELKSLTDAGKREEAHKLFINKVRENERAASAIIDPLISTLETEAAQMQVEAEAAQALSKTLVLSLGGGGVVLAVLLALAVILYSVVRPLARVIQSLERLSRRDYQADGLDTTRPDEIGQIGRTLTIFRDAMQTADRQKQKEIEEMAAREERQRRITAMISAFTAAMEEISARLNGTSDHLQSNASTMATTAKETASSAQSADQATERTAMNVQTVASASEELSASIDEINHRLAEATSIARSAVHQATSAAQNVEHLSQAAQQVGTFTQLIGGIASQTNLLALNATIEAARAGDAGKGFAVVASEVKNLASQTAKATDDIQRQVDDIQQATDGAVGAITGIVGIIHRISDITTSIAAAIEEQSAATREISRNVQGAAASTDEVRRDVAYLSTLTDSTRAASGTVIDSASAVAVQARDLQQGVASFSDELAAAI